uniref:SMP-30/gluconolactonase/LRE family protein n=1 Tax=Pedococcus sp. 5OH_020 TaxID=2989814 RepID=UPI0022E9FD08
TAPSSGPLLEMPSALDRPRLIGGSRLSLVMYLTDSARGVVFRYDLDDDGRLGGRTVFLDVEDGQPDGMTVDDGVGLWVAIWGAGQVRRYDSEGQLRESFTLPASQPTSPCLAGSRLFITTALYGLSPAQAGQSGAVFAVDVTETAPPAAAYVHRPRAGGDGSNSRSS